MSDLTLLLMAIFLPVFPLSMVFNALLAKYPDPKLRLPLVLGWPLVGILIYRSFEPDLPQWLVTWALFTAVLYGFRMLAMREVGRWVGYLATSAWACMWLPLVYGDADVILYLFGFGVPLALLILLVDGLEQRFGAAYTDLYAGLAQTIPRFSGIFVSTVLAAVATPVFPAFFTMLNIVLFSQPMVALVLVALWALWGWAGMRLVHGMVVGEPADDPVEDISVAVTWLLAGVMALLIVAGLSFTGDM